MNGTVAQGLAIPFTGTTAGAACVFFMRGALKESVDKALTGFAAGVMVAVLPYLLSFAAEAMIYAAAEEPIPEMSEGRHSNVGTLCFALGFTVMLALDVAPG